MPLEKLSRETGFHEQLPFLIEQTGAQEEEEEIGHDDVGDYDEEDDCIHLATEGHYQH